jgi:hypothetical protein
LQPLEDAAVVELMVADELEVFVFASSIHEADRALERTLCESRFHPVFDPHRIYEKLL